MVGAAIGFLAENSLFIVIAIERAEIAGIEANLLIDVPSTTKSEAIAVASKRCVLLIAVAQTIVRALSTTTDSDVSIPLDGC